MHSESLVIPAVFSANGIDDGIVALILQLEEPTGRGCSRQRKYTEGQPPDTMRALLEYQNEVTTSLQSLNDLKPAHSIAHTVDPDGPVIANLISLEVQASTDDSESRSAAPPPDEEIKFVQSFMLEQKQYINDSQWDTGSVLGDGWTTQIVD